MQTSAQSLAKFRAAELARQAAERLVHGIDRVVSRLLRWQELAAQRRALASLDDRMLKDIGLTRADVMREIAQPFWNDPHHPEPRPVPNGTTRPSACLAGGGRC